ncbi:MAG TPA: PaaI family thioesterase [Blastocatellia bacterium]|nr:PaaI family thioesterase [Blastocatellia bacterium]
MPQFNPQDPQFEARVRSSFARQTLMQTIGAEMTKVAAGEVEIELAYRDDLAQQHGYLHAGVITAIVDSACGYAAMTLTRAVEDILTIEYKANFVAPATGEKMIARSRVLRAGRKVTVCAGDVFALRDEEEKLIATMLATMMTISPEKG